MPKGGPGDVQDEPATFGSVTRRRGVQLGSSYPQAFSWTVTQLVTLDATPMGRGVKGWGPSPPGLAWHVGKRSRLTVETGAGRARAA